MKLTSSFRCDVVEGNQNSSHVKRIAEFAVEAVAAASNIMIDEEDPSAGCVHIRVGFHSGQVVSNVIGSLNPRYALFGDTMNTASRMESLSTSDRIQCSEHSARILKEQAPDFPLKRRGKVAVKGKGQMVTYWAGRNLNMSGRNLNMSRSRSNSPGFDSKPIVDFQAEDEPKKRKPHKKRPKRVDMTGSVEFDPSNSAPAPSVRKSILMKGRNHLFDDISARSRRSSFSSQ